MPRRARKCCVVRGKTRKGGPRSGRGGTAADELWGEAQGKCAASRQIILREKKGTLARCAVGATQTSKQASKSRSSQHDARQGQGSRMRRGWGQLRRLHNKRMPRWAPVGRGGSRWVPARALPGCLSAAVLESGQEKGGGGGEGGGLPEWSRKERAAHLQERTAAASSGATPKRRSRFVHQFPERRPTTRTLTLVAWLLAALSLKNAELLFSHSSQPGPVNSASRTTTARVALAWSDNDASHHVHAEKNRLLLGPPCLHRLIGGLRQ